MLPIFWRASAREDLLSIVRYIAERNPSAARAMRDQIASAILPTATHPYLFRSGRVAGTREIVAHPNYIVVYQVLGERIEVVSVLHSREQYP